MAPAQPIQIFAHSRTLRVTWTMIALLAILPVVWLWIVPWLRAKNFELPLLMEPGTTEWIIVFAVGSIGCVILLVGQILAFQNRKVPLGPRAIAAIGVLCTLLLWAYWLYATTTKSVAAAPAIHSVKLAWKPSTSPVVGYNIYRSTTPGQFTQPKLNDKPVTDTIYIDKTVQDNVTYYYSTRAVDAKGNESPNSNIASAFVP
jgi:hypothetical protein